MDWLVIGRTNFTNEKNGRQNMYKLREGDIIKIGKIMFKIRELKPLINKETGGEMKEIGNETCLYDKTKVISFKSKATANIELDNNNNMNRIKIQSNIKNQEEHMNNNHNFLQLNVNKNISHPQIKKHSCRICLSEGEIYNSNTLLIDNPLINPCNCLGSVRFIHLECLRYWLSSKITTKSSYDNSVRSYSFKEFECEICKTIIPYRIQYNKEIITLVHFENFSPPYILLESLNLNTQLRDNLISIYAICFSPQKASIKIGRSNDSELRLTDISVSRNHSQLIYNKGNFYIEDNRSKFGSLLLIQNEIQFLPYQNFSIQVGKFHLTFKLFRTIMSWFKCYRNKRLSQMNYEMIFHQLKLLIFEEENKNIKCLNYKGDISNSLTLDEKDNIKNSLVIKQEDKIDNSNLETENNNISAMMVNSNLNSSKVRLINENEDKPLINGIETIEKKIEKIFRKENGLEFINTSKKRFETNIKLNSLTRLLNNNETMKNEENNIINNVSTEKNVKKKKTKATTFILTNKKE